MSTPEEKERNRKRRENKIAKDLRSPKYKQRVKESKKKEYKREKLKPEDVEEWYDE